MGLGGAFEKASFGGSEQLATKVISNKTGEVLAGAVTDALGNALGQGVNNAAQAGSLTSLGDFGKAAGGVGTAITGIASLWGAYNAWSQGKEQIAEMKKQNALMDEQRQIENARYDKREAERVKANADIAAAASLDTKNHLPTNRF